MDEITNKLVKELEDMAARHERNHTPKYTPESTMALHLRNQICQIKNFDTIPEADEVSTNVLLPVLV